MGFLNRKKKYPYHGKGSTNPTTIVTPLAAVTNTGVFSPTIVNPPTQTQTVFPTVAISTSGARNAFVSNGTVPSPSATDWIQADSTVGLVNAAALTDVSAYYVAFSSGRYGLTSHAHGDSSIVKAVVGSFAQWKHSTSTSPIVAGVAGQSFSIADPFLNPSADQTLVFGAGGSEKVVQAKWTLSPGDPTTAILSGYTPLNNYPVGTYIGIGADEQVTLGKSLYVPLKHAFIHTRVYHGARAGVTADLGGTNPFGIAPAFSGDNSNNTFFNTDDASNSGVKRDMIIRSTTNARSYFIFYGDNIDAVHPIHFACDAGLWNYQCLPNPGIKPDQLWGQYEDRVIDWQPSSVGTTTSNGMSPDSSSDGILRMWINGFQIFNITNGKWGTEKMVAYQGPTTFRSPKFATSEIYEIYPIMWEAGQVPGAVIDSQVVSGDPTTGSMVIQLTVPSSDSTGVPTSIKVQRFVSGSFVPYTTIALNTTASTDNRITGRQNVTITGLTLGASETLRFAQSNALGDSAYAGDITFNVGAVLFTGPTAVSLHPFTPSTIAYGSDFSGYTTTSQITADTKFKSPNFISPATNLLLDPAVLYNGVKGLRFTSTISILWDWHLTGVITDGVIYYRFRHFPYTLGTGRRKIFVLNFDDGGVNSPSVNTAGYGSNSFSFEYLNRAFTPVFTAKKKDGTNAATNTWTLAGSSQLGTNFSQDAGHAFEFAIRVTPIAASTNGGMTLKCYMRRDDSSIWKFIGTQTIKDPTFNTIANPIGIKVLNVDNQQSDGVGQHWVFDILVNDAIAHPGDFDFSTAVNYTPY